ncbi:isopeptide-forming domain-containing fimbrial protein [Corynebacterium diphtheriae]|nr:isopeptide-forming domain-containing fimbrial protein [Corynebacterium diphtheriae]
MNKFSRTARSVTFAAIVGLSLGVSAPGAFAQAEGVQAEQSPVGERPEVASAVQNPDSPLVNPSKKGSLTVYKYIGEPGTKVGAPTGTAADGEKIAEGFKGFEAEFTIYKINKTADGKQIDLTTNEGLVAAAGLKPEQYLDRGSVKNTLVESGVLTKVKQGKTTGGKLLVGDQLDLAPYLVVETQPEPFKDPETGNTVTVDAAVPFIAFVPMTENNANGAQGTKWNYDVRAYPKNFKNVGPTKKVEDKDQNSGDKKLVYNIDSRVRNLAQQPDGSQEKLTVYRVEDIIDPKLKVSKVEVTVNDKPVVAQGLEINGEAAENGVKEKEFLDNTVKVNFTGEALAALKSNDKVQVKITTQVDPQSQLSGYVPNQAKVFENKPGEEQNAEIQAKPTEWVHTFWGGLEFTKIAEPKSGQPEEGLSGAEFQIVRVAKQGKLTDDNKDKACESVNVKDKGAINRDAVNGTQNNQVTKTFVSGPDGKVTITGLHVNDFENNAWVAEGERSVYCLVETKAPKGKELLAKAIPFQLSAKEVTGDQNSQDYNRKYELATVQVGEKAGKVVNLDDTTPGLPMTGGAGVGILAAIGAAIIGAGAWFARRNSAES